jgi:hypothetical protein
MKYFAYGSNLLLARLQERTPSATRLGRGRLSTHRLRWHKRGVMDGSGKCDAFQTGDAAALVWGALFEIGNTERVGLDDAEGLGRGYRATEVSLETAAGPQTAFTYVATPDAIDGSLTPFDWYRDLVVAGAYESGLPAEYIDTLTSVTASEDRDHLRSTHHRRLLGVGPRTSPADPRGWSEPRG